MNTIEQVKSTVDNIYLMLDNYSARKGNYNNGVRAMHEFKTRLNNLACNISNENIDPKLKSAFVSFISATKKSVTLKLFKDNGSDFQYLADVIKKQTDELYQFIVNALGDVK